MSLPSRFSTVAFESLFVGVTVTGVMALATDAVWPKRDDAVLMRTFIGKLRRNLGDDDANPLYILNERGIGNRMPSRTEAESPPVERQRTGSYPPGSGLACPHRVRYVPRSGLATRIRQPFSFPDAFGDLFPVHGHRARRADAKPHPPAPDLQHRDRDVVPDRHSLSDSPRQCQHDQTPLPCPPPFRRPGSIATTAFGARIQAQAMGRLRALASVAGKPAPHPGRDRSGTDRELLTVLDARLAGKSWREAAVDLHGAKRVAEWDTDGWMRSRVRRLGRRALMLMEGGYRNLVAKR